MNQYIYNGNEIPKMLFSELVMAYTISNNKKYYDEIVRRLSFCDFSSFMITELITYELEILKTTKKIYNTLLVNKKWWTSDIEKYEKEKLLKEPLEQYLLYYNGKMSETTLTSSEIVSIIDEANLIYTKKELYPDNIVNECKYLIESNKNLKDEFINRIIYIYERETKEEYSKDIFNSAMRFFINESHIIFKYKYAYHNSKILYEPYSEDYFNYHKN